MGRPKGSKNKASEIPAKAVNVAAKWTPAPDMGDVKPPLPSESNCRACFHKKAVHYGGKSNWCNTNGCNCQEMK